MAGVWKNVALVFLFLILGESSKLNVPRVLLPIFRDFSTNYTLEVTEGGCYTWSLNRYDVVSITPVNKDPVMGCSSRAVVSTKLKELKRDAVMMLAEEVHSKQVLRCNIIVAPIVSLDIVTKTRELFMEEAPEVFEVRAYDDQANEFSTLEGVEFQWSVGVSNLNQKDPATNVLRLITFRESPYDTPPSLSDLEKSGKRGSLALLEGSKTGSAKVSVRLPHYEYRNVATVEVQLMVLANLFVEPSDVHVLQGCTVRFHLKQIQNGHLEEIVLPSPQYFLEIEDTSIGQINEDGVAQGIEMGKTKVVLRDKYIKEDTGIKMPSASFTVAKAQYVKLNVLPDYSWILMMSRKYEIVAEVYDNNDRKLHIDQNVEMNVEIPKTHFLTEVQSKNKSYNFGQPLTPGEAIVKATLIAVKSPFAKRMSYAISAEEKMTIVKKIMLEPEEVILPWDPVIRPKYEVQLTAKGGDGNFVWSSNDTSVAIMTQAGVLKTLSHGVADIVVSMARNPYNKEICRVYVIPPSHLEIVDYMMEAELFTPIYIHVALYAESPKLKGSSSTEKKMFYQCRDIPFKINVGGPDFIFNSSIKATPVENACTTLAVVGVNVGTSKVTVSYTRDDRHTMEDSVVVASYRPLRYVHPDSGETVLAVGTSRAIVFEGGPRPWVGHSSENHRKYVNLTGAEYALSYSEVRGYFSDHADLYVYNVYCVKLGEIEMTLSISNVAVTKHSRNIISEASVMIYCAKPLYVSLYAELRVPNPGACPLNLNAEKVVAQSYQDFDVTVIVKDELGRTFENVTSLLFQWTLSDSSLANISYKDGVFAETFTENNVDIPFRHYQIIKPSGQAGQFLVTVSIENYNEKVLSDLNITPESPPFYIRDTNGFKQKPDIKGVLTVILVNDTVIKPNYSVIYNHPENKVNLQVNQGSGHYEFLTSSDEIADLNYIEGARVIEISPKSDGLLKIALADLCLVSHTASAEVLVIGLGRMKVDVPDKVEWGKSIRGTIHLYDSMDNFLTVPDISLLDLRPVASSNIIDVKLEFPERDDKGNKIPQSTVHFTITGLELGETSLMFLAQQRELEVRSIPETIQVFPPLRLLPRNLTLLIGSSFQVTSRGGPQPDCIVEYSVNSNIASVASNGIVKGLNKGGTKLIARAIGTTKDLGQRIVYSQDSIEIDIIPLKGIKIHGPLFRMKKGCTMPVYAAPIPDQVSPLILGSIDPPVVYKWSVAPKDVAELKNVYHDIGLDVEEKDMISMRLTALKSGTVTLQLTASVRSTLAAVSRSYSSDDSYVSFTDSMEIQVFEGIHLTHPPQEYKDQSPLIIMAPLSELQLRTNRDGIARLSYATKGHSIPGISKVDNMTVKAVGSATGDVVTVDQFGSIKAHNSLGQSIVTVTAHEEFGVNHNINVIVMVKQVWYIMINLQSRFRVGRKKSLGALPKGLEVEINVTYHDHEGLPFTSVLSELKLRSSRSDLTQWKPGTDNTTIHLHLLHEGSAVLKVWDEKTLHHSADYVKLDIGSVIAPNLDRFTVGDIACFTAPLVDEEGTHGTWKTSDSSIVYIDPNLGVSQSRAVGAVELTYNIGNEVIARLEAEVLPLDSISFVHAAYEHNISNPGPEFVYNIPILLTNKVDQNKVSNMAGCKRKHIPVEIIDTIIYPFICDLSFKDPDVYFDTLELFSVSASFDTNTGNYVCKIQPQGEPSFNKSLIQSHLSLRVSGNKIITEPLTLYFYPAFYLHTKELYFSDAQISDKIKISGRNDVLSKIKVRAQDSRMLAISEGESVSPTEIEFEVHLESYYWTVGELSTHLNVLVISDLTQQRVEIPVKVRLSGNKFSGPGCMISQFTSWGEVFYFYRHTLGMLITAVAFFFLIIYIYNSYFRDVTLPGRSLMSPNGSAYVTAFMPSGSPPPGLRRSPDPNRSYFEETQHSYPVYGTPSPGVIRRRAMP